MNLILMMRIIDFVYHHNNNTTMSQINILILTINLRRDCINILILTINLRRDCTQVVNVQCTYLRE